MQKKVLKSLRYALEAFYHQIYVEKYLLSEIKTLGHKNPASLWHL